MEERIIKFIAALRALGVRVSLAESADAFEAIEKLGVQEKQTFRLSLRATLVKDQKDLAAFDQLFPHFFEAENANPLSNLTDDLTPEEARVLAQALEQFSQYLQDILERLMQGDPLAQEELEKLAQRIGMQHANDLRHQKWMARRMEQAMKFEEVRNAILQLAETLAEFGMDPQRLEQFTGMMQANQESWQEQTENFVGQQIAENLSELPREEAVDRLMNRPFNALSENDMQILRQEVRRLAAALRSRIALRQKKAKKGVLDPKATIRANLKHGGVPIRLKLKARQLKPKLVVICDISTSMRYCSELMLSLIYELKDQVNKTQAFAFIDRLEYISPDFIGKQADEAVKSVLVRMPPGYYSTDLGYSLFNFASDYMDKIDSRTSLIIVGDGRNNYNNPHTEIFRKMARRSHRTIWINPEHQAKWGSGDSDMWKYAPYCDDILKADTLKELTSAIDQLLS